jgi:hypothetical protein
MRRMASTSPWFQASNEGRTISTSCCDIARAVSHLAGRCRGDTTGHVFLHGWAKRTSGV